MKRDMDLVREILLAIEAAPVGSLCNELELPGRDNEVVSYHVGILKQAELLEATDCSDTDGICFIPTSLTWQGHEFIDAARDETIWKKAREKIGKATSSLSFELLKQTLIAMLKQHVGMP